MRTGLVLLLGLLLAATPAVAQGKTKSSPVQEAVATLRVCETFAKGDVLAVDAAIEAGWDAYEQESESPYIRTYSASREMPGIGWGDLFVLVENYPDRTLGYCRLDVVEPAGKGETVIDGLAALDGFEGDVTTQDGGTYASLSGTGDNPALLLSHWDDSSFVIQLTTITPKAASGNE